MGDFTIVYEGPSGRQEEELTDNSTLNLYMRAATRVSLEAVRHNSELTILELSKNQLESIDLEPLRSCSKLEQVRMRSNRLTSIDLWPLIELTSLEEIDLVDNRIHEINITPLIGKVNLLLDDSVTVSIDNVLRYLVSGKDTATLRLCKPSGETLVSSPRIQWRQYSDLSDEYGWETVHYNTLCILEGLDERCWFRAQKGLLEGLGISELSGFDGDPALILQNFYDSTEFHSIRSRVIDVVIGLLDEQLSSGGPTMFLDVKKMVGTRASKLIPLITTLRDSEVENAVVQIGGNRANLLPLWLTHWGFEILSVLRFGLTTDIDGLDLIQRNFKKLGFELETENTDPVEIETPKNMSKGLIDFVYGIASMN